MSIRFAATAVVQRDAAEQKLSTPVDALDLLLAQSAQNAARKWYWRLSPEEREHCLYIEVRPYLGPSLQPSYDGQPLVYVPPRAPRSQADAVEFANSDASAASSLASDPIADLAGVVAGDMDAIFNSWPRHARAPRPIKSMSPRDRWRARLQLVGTIGAAALVIMSIGHLVVRYLRTAPPAAANSKLISPWPVPGGLAPSKMPNSSSSAMRPSPASLAPLPGEADVVSSPGGDQRSELDLAPKSGLKSALCTRSCGYSEVHLGGGGVRVYYAHAFAEASKLRVVAHGCRWVDLEARALWHRERAVGRYELLRWAAQNSQRPMLGEPAADVTVGSFEYGPL